MADYFPLRLKVLQLLEHYGELDTVQIAEHLGVHRKVAGRQMRRMAHEQNVVAIGETKHSPPRKIYAIMHKTDEAGEVEVDIEEEFRRKKWKGHLPDPLPCSFVFDLGYKHA